jgi:hypothetical protein
MIRASAVLVSRPVPWPAAPLLAELGLRVLTVGELLEYGPGRPLWPPMTTIWR